MKTSVIGFPRIGKLRELKFAEEKYFRKEISLSDLFKVSAILRKEHWKYQNEAGIDFIPSNDFSLYDNVLDTAFMLNAIPERYKKLKENSEITDTDIYFAMARGYQGEAGDVSALPMKKWFNTNYHYIVPELEDNTKIKLNADKIISEFEEALDEKIKTKPVVTGPFTFLKLAYCTGKRKSFDFSKEVTACYKELFEKLSKAGAEWIQLDEPGLCRDLSAEDKEVFVEIYNVLLREKAGLKVLLSTYFGDIRDCYDEVISLDFDGIGLDFVEGEKTLDLIKTKGFPEQKSLFAGIVNGKNIWKCNYKSTLDLLQKIKENCAEPVLSSSCSLLHVPYTLEYETVLSDDVRKYFSFALDKLKELSDIAKLSAKENISKEPSYSANLALYEEKAMQKDETVWNRLKALSDVDFTRNPKREKRRLIQNDALELPLLPTTTIGSFPQTKDVKENRSAFKKGEKDRADYDKKVYEFISECIKLQEEIGLDVLVHGEFERNDMVEFFGENLDGFIFTEKAWVQSYGTRCVKPPIIFSDIKRKKSITTDYIKYAQGLTKKYVKGMLTGPVTILNWSFPREDISLKDCAFQIALAIREEVAELEAAGIKIIQIDEAALREKLPLRKQDWYIRYLDWAIPAFRLCHSGVKPETQIHTHMCYSEFTDIIKDIDNMDADVISFEASRSDLKILDSLQENNFETQVGPGVYDIHSPRIPGTDEIIEAIRKILDKVDAKKLWINPDCGLKTRGITETKQSLKNLVNAAKTIREKL